MADERALQAAEQGLRENPRSVSCILAMASAFCDLGQYVLAASFLKEAIEQQHQDGGGEQGSSEQLQSAYIETQRLVDQSTLGRYELSGYYMGGCLEQDAPKLADYVGPVIVAKAEGKGRGVFLTKAVVKGELLMVSNAIGLDLGPVNIGPFSSLFDHDTRKELWDDIMKTCRASPTKLAQVLSLRNKKSVPVTGDIRQKFLMLELGLIRPPDEEVPSMDLFRPNDWPALVRAAQEMLDGFEDLDIEEEVGCREQLDRSVTDDMEPLVTMPYCGMWVLPSLINHSCMGNVSLHRVGRALLVLASRDMETGSELERSYGGPYRPWLRRVDLDGDFMCRCTRCTLECGLNLQLKTCRREFLVQKVDPLEVEAEIERLNLTEEQGDCVRVSYMQDYVRKRMKLPSQVAEAAMRAMHAVVPGYSCNLQFMAYLNEVAGTPSARQLLEEECVARVGRLAPEVLQAVIDDAIGKPVYSSE